MSDMLVKSAHFDSGNYFFADRPDAGKYLKVGELECVSLSECSQGGAQLLKRGIPRTKIVGSNTQVGHHKSVPMNLSIRGPS
jgi:hypothetical protein